MDQSTLRQKLEDLKQKSTTTIDQLNEHEKIAQTLREDALIIKGEYQALEKLLVELAQTVEKKVKK